MAKLEYLAECLCGGKIKCLFKKPTQMQDSISRGICSSCRSTFLFKCFLNFNDKGRAYCVDHEAMMVTQRLRKVLKAKKEEMKKAQAEI